MVPKIFRSIVLENKKVAPSVNIVRFSVPKEFSFEAGQYVSITVNNGDKKIRRSYSIASSPKEKFIEIVVRRIPNGPGSNYLCDLKEEEEVEFIGPLGRFTINANSKSKEIVFVSTGTGVGPFISMISYLLESGSKDKITAVNGFRTENDILYKSFFEEMKKKFNSFYFYNILSQPNHDAKNKGYVQNFLDKIIHKEFEGDIYVCGLKEMIDDVVKKLNELGVNKEQIFFERYD